MKIEYRYSPEEKKKMFGDGEWVNEPDDIQFIHEGLKCSVKRTVIQDGPYYIFGGHLCGYVEIKKGHPFFGEDPDYIELDLDVHGGITCSHVVDKDWMIGFDCAHSGDTVPSMTETRKRIKSDILGMLSEDHREVAERSLLFEESYKNIEFCIQECKNLAEQIKKIG